VLQGLFHSESRFNSVRKNRRARTGPQRTRISRRGEKPSARTRRPLRTQIERARAAPGLVVRCHVLRRGIHEERLRHDRNDRGATSAHLPLGVCLPSPAQNDLGRGRRFEGTDRESHSARGNSVRFGVCVIARRLDRCRAVALATHLSGRAARANRETGAGKDLPSHCTGKTSASPKASATSAGMRGRAISLLGGIVVGSDPAGRGRGVGGGALSHAGEAGRGASRLG
jgi:hypothetical protein